MIPTPKLSPITTWIDVNKKECLRLFHLPVSHTTIFLFHRFFYYLSTLENPNLFPEENILFYYFIVRMFLHNTGTQFLALLIKPTKGIIFRLLHFWFIPSFIFFGMSVWATRGYENTILLPTFRHYYEYWECYPQISIFPYFTSPSSLRAITGVCWTINTKEYFMFSFFTPQYYSLYKQGIAGVQLLPLQ